MSFGVSVGDFATLGQLAWKIYKACKDAPDSFKNISQEVSSLSMVLKEVEEALSDSGLSAPQQSCLESVGNGCRVVLEDLQSSLDRYNSLGTKNKRTWDRLGWGSRDIAEFRSRLISNTVMLTTLVNTFQINVQKKLDIFKQECRDGKHEGSIVSTQTVESLSADEQQAWRAIRKELEDIGISVEAFDANKDFILNWFKTAISTGAFEEQTLESEPSSMLDGDDLSQSWEDPRRDTLFKQHLKDPETGTNLPSPSIKPYNTKLFEAVQSGDETKIRELLEEGVDINMKDLRGMTPLHHAVRSNSEGIVRLLLREGAEILPRDIYGRTALHMAVQKIDYSESMAQLLLDNGSDINSKDESRSTEPHPAARYGDAKVVELLLNQGAKIEEKDWHESTALHYAAMFEDEQVVKLLLNRGAKVEEKDNDGYTALHWAVIAGQVTVAQLLLLENGRIVFWEDRHGLPLLYHAVTIEDDSKALLMTQLLLESGANPNEKIMDSKYNAGTTVLHWAAMYGREEIVQKLLDDGAEVEESDKYGNTALDAASLRGQWSTRQILLDRGAETCSKRMGVYDRRQEENKARSEERQQWEERRQHEERRREKRQREERRREERQQEEHDKRSTTRGAQEEEAQQEEDQQEEERQWEERPQEEHDKRSTTKGPQQEEHNERSDDERSGDNNMK
ncbi:hypothetical protein MMC07_008641 [Pseudocyphellaria aurata]|nr:hypothetical protein [Pseudocyphellaria aurata]